MPATRHNSSINLLAAVAFAVSLLLPAPDLISQGHRVTGRIIEKASGRPIPDVTVYINGTSKGTISGPGGGFSLDGVTLPSEVILSHVSYQLMRVRLIDASLIKEMHFPLSKKVVQLEEATVMHTGIRAQYLERFREWFLGEDYRSYDAEILNDSILVFDIRENGEFSVYAGAPILVSLPQAGYLLKVDLIRFTLQHHADTTLLHGSTLGYFYFEPVEAESRRTRRRIARNRVEQYYNSRMHFCRSPAGIM